jgi:hypothetical protein
MTSQTVDQKLGRMAYDAYCVQLGIGPDQDVPPWDGLEGKYQDAWISAARTVEAYAYEQANLDD